MRNIYYLAKERMKANPFLFYSLWRFQESARRTRRVVRPDFDIVIEGFPRSGNTFATMAFMWAQHSPRYVANHFHSPAQFKLAAKWRIPALLLIREPEPTVLSNVVYYPKLSLDRILKGYLAFYRSVLPLVDGLIVATFPQVTTDFGSVIERVNTRYKTEFDLFEHSDANVKSVLHKVDEHHNALVGESDTERQEATRTTPSRYKERQKARFVECLHARKNAPLLSSATELYDSFRAKSQADGRS